MSPNEFYHSITKMDSYCYVPLWATLILTLLYLKTIFNTKKNLPPGPSLFSCGAMLCKLATQPHKVLAELAQVHGPLMTLKLGPITSVVVSSSTVARQALLRSNPDHFSTPFVLDAVYAHNHHQYSVAWLPSSSPEWRALRRLYGGHVMSSRRLDATRALRRQQVTDLLDHLRQHSIERTSVDVGHVALMTFFEVMLAANFSRDLAGQNPEEIKELMVDIIKATGGLNVADWFPILHVFDAQGIRHRLTLLCKKLFRVFDQIIDTRLKIRNVEKGSSALRADEDVLDLLLDVMESQKDGLDRNFVHHTLLDLFGAGMDTTAKTVEWGMSELLSHPKTLKKVQDELDEIVGKGKAVEESDISKLPYFESVLKEVFRLHPPAPLLLPRKIDEDVVVSGYTIPKGTRMLVNVWAIGRDPDKWENPNLFRPERFSDVKIDLKGQHFELIPFGAGRRICPGMPLALRAVPVILASLVSCFDWRVEERGEGDGKHEFNMQDKVLITLKKVKALRAIPISRC